MFVRLLLVFVVSGLSLQPISAKADNRILTAKQNQAVCDTARRDTEQLREKLDEISASPTNPVDKFRALIDAECEIYPTLDSDERFDRFMHTIVANDGAPFFVLKQAMNHLRSDANKRAIVLAGLVLGKSGNYDRNLFEQIIYSYNLSDTHFVRREELSRMLRYLCWVIPNNDKSRELLSKVYSDYCVNDRYALRLR